MTLKAVSIPDPQMMAKGHSLPGSPTHVAGLDPLEGCQSTQMDEWSLMEEAMKEQRLEEGMDLDQDYGAQPTNFKVAYLPDGDIHICMGTQCPHAELNEDKCYVCRLSGFVLGPLSLREDYSTGRQAGSSNPDDRAGEPVGGQWKPKKDMAGLSSAAFNAAETLKEEEEILPVSPAQKKEAGAKPPTKRGARCVDEPIPEHATPPKRARRVNRLSMSSEKFRSMAEDAQSVLCKLVNFDRRPEAKPTKDKPSKAARDPRLMDKDFLFQAALKKYSKECLATGTAPTLDAVHNIALVASNVALEEKRRVAQEEQGSTAKILKVRMREQVTTLACALWTASCETPYMDEARRGADSFRPFICGVFYALKRGVSLPDGTVVVPACPKLAESLPALRATAANSVAKGLHASSHRGLCTLHRSISSCSSEQAQDIYETCARLAQTLSRDVQMGRFDLF